MGISLALGLHRLGVEFCQLHRSHRKSDLTSQTLHPLCQMAETALSTPLLANWPNKRKGELSTQGNGKPRDSFRLGCIQGHLSVIRPALPPPSSPSLTFVSHWALASSTRLGSVTGVCEWN